MTLSSSVPWIRAKCFAMVFFLFLIEGEKDCKIWIKDNSNSCRYYGLWLRMVLAAAVGAVCCEWMRGKNLCFRVMSSIGVCPSQRPRRKTVRKKKHQHQQKKEKEEGISKLPDIFFVFLETDKNLGSWPNHEEFLFIKLARKTKKRKFNSRIVRIARFLEIIFPVFERTKKELYSLQYHKQQQW